MNKDVRLTYEGSENIIILIVRRAYRLSLCRLYGLQQDIQLLFQVKQFRNKCRRSVCGKIAAILAIARIRLRPLQSKFLCLRC
jgi:hypothetical protein